MTFTKNGFGITTSDDCQDGIAMLGEAGGDFRINMQQCSYPITRTRKVGVDDTITEVEHVLLDAWVPTRADTGEAISSRTVGEGFTVFDNHDAVELVNTICREHSLRFAFMAVLNGGAGLAMQVECPDLTDALMIGGDAHKGFLTIITAHDGSASLRVTPTLIRMMCKNRLPALKRENTAKSKTGDAYLIRHSRRMEDRISDMIGAYREAMGHMIETGDRLRLLSTKRITATEQNELWDRVIAAGGQDEGELSKRAQTQRANKLEAIRMLSLAPENQPADAALHGTFYHALQPLTAYGTRGIATRDRGTVGEQERRWTSANTGAGAAFSLRALEVACEMAGV